ncbi:MAG: hypothetical protein DGJ47_000903 [Rickettsiaceae bacterium]
MTNKITSKLGFFVNLFNNLFHNDNVVIFVGHKGIILTALRRHTPVDESFIEYSDDNFNKKYKSFLSRYKKFHIKFLLDTKDTKLNRQILPVVSSIIKLNPVDKFIEEHYSPEDIIAYNVYNISNSESEIWNTLIASAKYIDPLKGIIEYVLNKSYKFSGIYLLPLECRSIIRRILKITNNEQNQSDLQVFVTIFKSSGVKLVVKRKNNILYYRSFDLPKNKSQEYIKGYIEQIICDQLLECKDYIERHNANKCIVMLVDPSIKETINEKFCAPNKVIVLSPDELKLPLKNSDDYYQESSIINLFKDFNSHLAYNSVLKQITKYTLINNVVFKPVIILLFALSINVLSLQYRAFSIESKTQNMNDKYYKLAQDYRDITKKYPQLYNISDLVDLYNLEQIVNQKASNSIPFIKYIDNLQNTQINLKSLSWKVDELNLINIPESSANIEIELKYGGLFESRSKALSVVDAHLNHMKSIFSNNEINYTINEARSYEISHKHVMPVKFKINGKVGQ